MSSEENADELQLLSSMLQDDVQVMVNPFKEREYIFIVERGKYILKMTLNEVKEKVEVENARDTESNPDNEGKYSSG
jgi:hypothetical protein